MSLYAVKESIGKALHRIGISADALTLAGLACAFFSAYLIYRGLFVYAGVALLASGFLDLLDGAVARASGKSTVFGGILDSTLDRYGDGIVLGSLLVSAAMYKASLYLVAFSLSALLGSFAISYVRARSECEFDSCRIGFWERGERLVLLSLGLLSKNLLPAVAVLGIGVHWTVAQRLWLSHRLAQGKPAPTPPPGRTSLIYLTKAAALAAFAIFAKLNP